MGNQNTASPQAEEQMTDEQWMDAAAKGTLPAPTLQAQTAMTDEQWMDEQARITKENPNSSKPGVVTPVTPIGQPLTPKPQKPPDTLQGAISETVAPFYKFVGDEWQIGTEGMHESEEGMHVLAGRQSYEQAESSLETSKAERDSAQKRTEVFRNTSAAYHAFAIASPAFESLPFLVRLAGAYGGGFATGAGIGAASGAIAAAPTGEVAAPITVPAGVLAAGAMGGNAANSVAMGAYASGQAYMKYRRAGVPDAQARIYAVGEGVQQGAWGALRLGQVAGTFKNAVLDSASAFIPNFLKRYASTIGVQSLIGGAQAMQTQTMETLAAYTSNAKGLQHTFLEQVDRVIKAIADSAIQAAALGAATEAGAAIVKPWVAPKTVPEYLAIKKQMADNPESDLAGLPQPKVAAPTSVQELLTGEKPIEDTRSKGEIRREQEKVALQGRIEANQLDINQLETKLEKQKMKVKSLADKFKNTAKPEEYDLQQDLTFARQKKEELQQEKGALERSHRTEALAKVRRAADKGKVKNNKSEFLPGTDTQEVLDAIRDFVYSPEAADKAILEHIEAVQLDKTALFESAGTALRAQVAQMVGDTTAKNSTELFKLAAEIKELYTTGKTASLNKLLGERAEVKERNARLLEAFQGNKPVEINAGNTGSKENFSANELENFKRAGEAGLASWSGKLRIAMQDSPDLKGREALIDELNMNRPADRVHGLRKKRLNILVSTLQDATKMTRNDLAKKLAQSSKDIVKFKYLDAEGNEATYEAPRVNAIHTKANLNDKTLTEGFVKGNKYSGKTLGVPLDGSERTLEAMLDRALDKTDHELVGGIKTFYKELGPELQKLYYEETNVKIELGENYAGKVKRKYDTKRDIEESLSNHLASSAADKFTNKNVSIPKQVIPRSKNHRAIVSENFFTTAVKAVNEISQYEAWVKDSKPIIGMLADPNIRFVLNAKYPRLTKLLDQHAKDAIRGMTFSDGLWANFVSDVLRKAGYAFLALKPLQYPKQRTAGINFALYIPPQDVVFQHLKYYASGARAKYEAKFERALTARYDDFHSTLVQAATKGNENVLADEWIKQALMAPLTRGDRDTVLPGMAAVYEHELSKGATEDQAVLAAEKSLATQGSANIAELSALARDPNAKLVSIFVQQPTAMAVAKIQAYRDYFNHPSPETGARLVNTIAVTHIAQGVFAAVGAGVAIAVAGNDQQKREKALWGLFNNTWVGPQLPFIGDVNINLLAVVEDILTSQPSYPLTHQPVLEGIETKTIMDDIANNTTKLMIDSARLAKDDTDKVDVAIDIGLDYAKSINLLVGGYPLEPPLKLLKLIKKWTENH